MRFSKVLKIISLISFLLLLSPSNIYFCVFYYAVSALFISAVIKKTGYLNVSVSSTSWLISVLINMLLSIVFLHRWGNILGNTPSLMISIILALMGSWAAPAILGSFGSKKIEFKNINSKLTLTEFILCIGSSLLIMLIATRSTPLIPFNDYCDANVMFTIGRGIVNGKVPYRDLIDRKGPVVYFLHAIGAVISPRTFTGVWILEWISCFFVLVLGIRIRKILDPVSNKLSGILVLPLSAALYFTPSYLYGDNPESFCIPLILLCIYIGMRSILENRISFISSLTAGICIGIVFWMKFTICGAFIGMFIYLVTVCIRNRALKALFRSIGGLFSGFMIITVPVLLYYAVNNALDDLFNVYFINNIFSYNSNYEPDSFLTSLLMPVNMLGSYLGKNYFMYLFILAGLFFLLKLNGKIFRFVLLSFITCSVFAFIGAKSFTYYAFVLTAFAVTGWGAVTYIIRYITDLRIKISNTVKAAASVIISALFVVAAVTECPDWEILFLDLEDSPVYECSGIISQSDDPTLLCYDFLDRGFYTYNGIIPDVPYFTAMNSDYELVRMEQERYIQEGNYEFVITESVPHDFDGYELIYVDQNEGEGLPYYLYKRVGSNDGLQE